MGIKTARTNGQRKPLEYDQDQIDQKRYTKGFFAFVCTQDLSLKEALERYSLRGEVESVFKLMFANVLKSTRVHSSAAFEELLFVTAIALNILTELRTRMYKLTASGKPLKSNYTMHELTTMLQQVHMTVNESNQPVLIGLSAPLREALDRMEVSSIFETASTVQYRLSVKKIEDTAKQL